MRWLFLVVALLLMPLASSACAQQVAKTDLHGDPLPLGAIARLGTARLRHHNVIMSIALSPDGKTVASAGAWTHYDPNEAIRLWDLATGKQIRELLGHTGYPRQVVFSPDGKVIASVAQSGPDGHENAVRLWDAATGQPLHVIPGLRFGKEAAKRIAFSPDSKTLAFSDRGPSLVLADMVTGKELRRWPIPIASFLFSPDGKFIASGHGNAIAFWDPSTGNQVRKIDTGRKQGVGPLFFADGGRQLVGQSGLRPADREIVCLDWEKGAVVRVIPGAFLGASRDGRFVAVRGTTDIHLWDLIAGKEVRRFPRLGRFDSHAQVSQFTGVVTDDGGKLVSADWNTIRVIDTRTGNEERADSGHWDVVFVGFSKDDRRLISVGDKSVRTWDVASAKQTTCLEGHTSMVSGAAITKDTQTLATASRDGTARFWDLATGREKARIAIGRGFPHIAFSPDDRTLAVKLNGDGKNDIQLWDVPSNKELRRFGVGNSGEALAFLADGNLVDLSIGISIYDPDTGKELRRFDNMPTHNPSTSTALSKDGRIAAIGFADPKSPAGVPREVSLWHLFA